MERKGGSENIGIVSYHGNIRCENYNFVIVKELAEEELHSRSLLVCPAMLPLRGREGVYRRGRKGGTKEGR